MTERMQIKLYFLLLILATSLSAETLQVPDDYSSIQNAINAASNTDSILVAPGLYEESIDFNGKAIVVSSLYLIENDSLLIESTVIDGQEDGSVVTFDSGESYESILQGFTIQNGALSIGGGVLCNGAPLIENCVIKNNVSQLGAGIFHHDNGTDGPTVSGTHFCSNKGSDISGAWINGGGNTFEESCEGNSCPADITGDAVVNVSDLLAVIDAWGGSSGPADINQDGIVNVVDLLEVVGSWGSC